MEYSIRPGMDNQRGGELLRKSGANLEQSPMRLQEVQRTPQHQWEREVMGDEELPTN